MKRPTWVPGITLTQIMIRWKNGINNLRGYPCAISNINLGFLRRENICVSRQEKPVFQK